jgi:hypothetical protein
VIQEGVGTAQIGNAAADRAPIAPTGPLRLVPSQTQPRAPGLHWRADALRRRMLAAPDVIAGIAAAAILLSADLSWIWALARLTRCPRPLWGANEVFGRELFLGASIIWARFVRGEPVRKHDLADNRA